MNSFCISEDPKQAKAMYSLLTNSELAGIGYLTQEKSNDTNLHPFAKFPNCSAV